MRVDELYEAVAKLGFEDALEDGDSFYYAANRAIIQVNALRPAVAEYTIHHAPISNLLNTGFDPVIRDESDVIYTCMNPKAYYFEASGSGTLFIEKQYEDQWRLIGEREFSGERFASYRGFIFEDGEFTKGNIRLRFSASAQGDFAYFIKNIAMYSKIFSADEKHIPAFKEYAKYDMAELCDDFLTFEAPIIRRGEYYDTGTGFFIEGSHTILFPYNAEGIFKVLYRRRPKSLINDGKAEEDTTVIDLDDELCTLLPTLIASYVWAEDEPEKAQYYLALYRELAANIEYRAASISTSKVINKSGW
jgi:hypothetical protein